MDSSNRWQISVDTPTGEQQGILELEIGDGVCGGRLFNDSGELALEDGCINDGQLHWTLRLNRPIPMALTCQAFIEGNNLTGDVTIAAFGNFSFTGRLLNEHSD
jgi:hypothetical protein